MYVDNNKNRNACILENMHHILEQYFNCQIKLYESLHVCLGTGISNGGMGIRNLETIQT